MATGTINLADVKARLHGVPAILDAARTAATTKDQRATGARLRDCQHDLSYYRDELVALLTRGADAEPWPEDAHEHDEKVIYWRRALILYEQCCDALAELERYDASTQPRTTRTAQPVQARFD